jgi:hypothetical protein
VLARLSLRSRLVLGVIALATVGLALANVATYASLRSFLIAQTDRDLDESHSSVEQDLSRHGCGRDDGGPPSGASPGDYIEVRDATDDILCDRPVTDYGEEAQSPPDLSSALDELASNLAPHEAAYFTVDAIDGGHADAVLCASIFHYGKYTVAEAKQRMSEAGIPVRLGS